MSCVHIHGHIAIILARQIAIIVGIATSIATVSNTTHVYRYRCRYCDINHFTQYRLPTVYLHVVLEC